MIRRYMPKVSWKHWKLWLFMLYTRGVQTKARGPTAAYQKILSCPQRLSKKTFIVAVAWFNPTSGICISSPCDGSTLLLYALLAVALQCTTLHAAMKGAAAAESYSFVKKRMLICCWSYVLLRRSWIPSYFGRTWTNGSRFSSQKTGFNI